MAAGFIYILVTPANRKLLKIGKTTRSVEQRAIEVSGGPGVAAPFWVAYDSQVLDCDEAEKLIHKRLSKYRYYRNREFFELPLKEAIAVVMRVVEQISDRHSRVIPLNHPIVGHMEDMIEVLGPRQLAPNLSESLPDDLLIQGGFEVSRTYLEWKEAQFAFRLITSIQVWRGAPWALLPTSHMNALIINTLKGRNATSFRINATSGRTLSELYRILTKADWRVVRRWRDG